MEYKFIDIGCKTGSSFGIAKRFGYTVSEGFGIDSDPECILALTKSGKAGQVADATDLPFPDGTFELSIFSHILEHMAGEEKGERAMKEALRVCSNKMYLALPFFDEDAYLRSLGLRTYYSYWSGHKNMITLKKITEKYLFGYNFEVTMKKKINHSFFDEILPITAPKNSLGYDPILHGKKEFIMFDRDIWREYEIVVDKQQ